MTHCLAKLLPSMISTYIQISLARASYRVIPNAKGARTLLNTEKVELFGDSINQFSLLFP